MSVGIVLVGVCAFVYVKTDIWSVKNLQSISNKQPNIIFILTDDQALSDLEYMPKVQKYLVQEGKTFTNYFDNYAVCCVARASILRGQNANNTGIKGNAEPAGGYEIFHAKGADGEDQTAGVWLQNSGYHTVFMGKYLNGYGTGDTTFVPPGWSDWFGFSDNTQGLYDYQVNHNGKLVEYGSDPEDFKTDVLSKEVVAFLGQQNEKTKPYFIYLAPTAPHSPSTAAPRHEDMFKNVQVPRSASYNEVDVSDKPQFIRELPLLDDKGIKQTDNAYRKRLQSLQAVDDMVENIVTTLESTRQLDTTYIFFTSDNGFHLGQHRMPSGKRTAFEEDIHLPLVVRGPGVTPGTVDDIVGNIDFVPTWSEIVGGLSISYEPDGRSFAGLLSSSFLQPATWRNGYLIGFELDDLVANGGIESPAWLDKINNKKKERMDSDEQNLEGDDVLKIGFAGVRTKNYVYVEYGNGDKEFYDLLKDPLELQNAYSTADAKLIAQHQQMLTLLRTCQGASCKVAEQMPIGN